IISRATAYHGTPHGALSVTSLPGLREQFAPLVPGAHKVPNTNFYRAPDHLAHDEKAFGRWAADRIGEAIEFEGADSVAAVFQIISRATAYHGTPHGALSVTSLPGLREQFAPLVPGAHKVPNTNFYRAPDHLAHDEKAFGRWAADRIGEAIEFEGADSVAAVF